MFQAFAAHPDLAWFSQLLERLPRFPVVSTFSRLADWSLWVREAVTRSGERRGWWEGLRIGPAEANTVWQRCCGRDFVYGYLLGVEATDVERRRIRHTISSVLRYQGKPRFAAKITGPARLEYLVSIFPDARFIHVVRDGRAVVRSLMRVPFWRDTWRLNRPAWRGGLGDRELEQWEAYDRSPLALAAVQWRAVVRSARDEAARCAPTRYGEVRYEDFIANPHTTLDQLATFCGLRPSRAPHRFLDSRLDLRDMNLGWGEAFDPGELQMLNEVMGDTLEELGYGSSSSQPPARERLVTTPFADRTP